MTDGTSTPLPQPGWYPDHAGGSALRWWDGTQWTDHVSSPIAAQPYTTAQTPVTATDAAKAAATNPFAWIYALVPIVSGLGYALVNWRALGEQIGPSVSSGAGTTQLYSNGIVGATAIASLLGWVAVALAILFAVLDWNRLRKSGVERPFHWAFAFFALIGQPIVYMIGRSVVARRRTGRGLGPMWLFLAVQVAVWVLIIVELSIYVGAILSSIDVSTTGSFS